MLSTALASGVLVFLGIGVYVWAWESLLGSSVSEEVHQNRCLRLLAVLIRLAIWIFQASVVLQTAFLGVDLLFGG